jgi:hypothetical protein
MLELSPKLSIVLKVYLFLLRLSYKKCDVLRGFILVLSWQYKGITMNVYQNTRPHIQEYCNPDVRNYLF